MLQWSSLLICLWGSRNWTWQQPVIHKSCSPKLGNFGVPTITTGTRKATWHRFDHTLLLLLDQHAGCSMCIISGPKCLCFQLHPWLEKGYKPGGHSKHHSSFWKGFWELLPHSQEPPHHQTPAKHRDFSFQRRKNERGANPENSPSHFLHWRHNFLGICLCPTTAKALLQYGFQSWKQKPAEHYELLAEVSKKQPTSL